MELLRQQEAEYMEKIEQRKKEIAALEEQLKQSNDDEYIENCTSTIKDGRFR